MISIEAINLGKKYGTNRLFKNFSFSFTQNQHYCITGINGSGKSTFLLTLCGYITPTEGKIVWKNNNAVIENPIGFFSYTSPALELFEHLSLIEILKHHAAFCQTFNLENALDEIENMGLKKSLNKQVSSFSSGMKQRVKLIMALYNDVPVILLDEPCSNLDDIGLAQYNHLLHTRESKSMFLVATNQPVTEFPVNGKTLNLDDFKK